MRAADVNSRYLMFYMPVGDTIVISIQLHANWACLERM